MTDLQSVVEKTKNLGKVPLTIGNYHIVPEEITRKMAVKMDIDTAVREGVERVGKLNDSLEVSRWDVCREVELLYSELGAYAPGLTKSLELRLTKTSDTVYGMRNAWRLWEELRKSDTVSETPVLSSSHYGVMYSLRERFTLTLDTCREWLDIAVQENLHVRDLRQEVTNASEEDEQKAFARHVRKLERVMLVLYQDAESVGLPPELWNETKELSTMVKTWSGKISTWMKG